MSKNYFGDLTTKLIELIEKGTNLNWCKEWVSNKYTNPFSGTTYKGTNYLACMLDVALKDRSSTLFCTFNQAKANKLKIRKGAKSISIVYYGTIKNEDNEGNETSKSILRYSSVFNFDDIEGDKEKYITPSNIAPIVQIDEIKQYIENIEHNKGYGDPCYIPSMDKVCMPKIEQFSSIESYYSTYFHELSHWTSHNTRCDRPVNTNKNTVTYAKEELIAELSSVFLSSEFNLSYNLENHASYLGSWLSALRKEPNFLKEVIKDATKASNYLLSLR